MPVADFRFLIFFRPLADGSVGMDGCFGEAGQHLFQLLGKLSVFAEQLRSADADAEQVAQNLRIHRAPGAQVRRFPCFGVDVAVFGRKGRADDKPSGGVFHQVIGEKQRRVPQNRPILFQKHQVAAVLVMLPDVGAQPREAHHPERRGHPHVLRGGVAPHVGVVVRGNAAAAVHHARGVAPVGRHALQVAEQRQPAVGQAAAFRGPVVHFRVDVNGVFAAPRRVGIFVPDALQIRGQQGVGAAAGNQQVAPEVEVKRREAVVAFPGAEAIQALVGRKRVERRVVPEFQLHAAEKFPVFVPVNLK